MPYAPPLTDDEIAAALERLDGWERHETTIQRTLVRSSFRDAIALVNAVADAAEAANHHPDIELADYRRLTFRLTTHAAGAVTSRDVELAAEIDRLATIAGA